MAYQAYHFISEIKIITSYFNQLEKEGLLQYVNYDTFNSFLFICKEQNLEKITESLGKKGQIKRIKKDDLGLELDALLGKMKARYKEISIFKQRLRKVDDVDIIDGEEIVAIGE